jgi:hypothetical protein
MRYLARALFKISLAVVLGGLAGGIAVASDPPDSELNPVSGFIETVDSVWQESSYDVRHTTNQGPGQPTLVFMVDEDESDDLAPRVAIASNGNTWVTWWRDAATDQVLIRKRTYSPRAWSTETLVSDPGESSRNPEVVHDGSEAFVAYEFSASVGTSIAVSRIKEDPEPFGRSVLATTSFTGDVDVLIHTDSGHLWVTWVDSATYVGWSEYAYGTGSWGSALYESYAADSIAAARDRIRAEVLGE